MAERILPKTAGGTVEPSDRQLRPINLSELEVDLSQKEATLYTIPAAADAAGVEERTLRAAVDRGAVKAIKIEGSPIRVVTLEDVLTWKNRRRTRKK